MTTLKLVATIALAAAAFGCAREASPPAVGTTSTTSGLVCPTGYAPAGDGRTCVLLPLPAEDAPGAR